MIQIYDVVIIGAGPAGLSAAIYASMADLEVIVIDKNCTSGGHIQSEQEVKDFPGFPSIEGGELASMLRDHAEVAGAKFVKDEILSIDSEDPIKSIKSRKNEYSCRGLIIASGTIKKDDSVKASTAYINGVPDTDENGFVIAGEDCRSSVRNVYAAGSARTKTFNKIVTSLADGANAVNSFLEDIN